MSSLPVLSPARPDTHLIPHSPRARRIFLLFAAELLLTLLLQFPGVADFQKFAFYDEGAWLHLDSLFARGAKPTIDLGYSYGMLPLLLSRAWMALFGRSPWAFIGFVTACNLGAAWGMARILEALGATWPRVAAACLLLPLAIMPNNYSLMHPLEMMLIVLALSQLAQNRYGSALAWATLAVLTKPSMAYVLGLLLLLLAAWLKRGWRVLILPAAVGILSLILITAAVGMHAALANLLPLTGGRSYKAMGFGFFAAGKTFWMPPLANPLSFLGYYLFTPAGFWIAATLALWVFGILAAVRLLRRTWRPADPLLLAAAVLHAAFVFVFYAWAGSWTYYSYLLVIGLLAALPATLPGRRALWIAASFAALSLLGRYGDALGRWMGTERSPEAGGLFVYSDVMSEARDVRTLARSRPSLYMINGALPMIWPEARTPPCWFVSPGIPTAAEMQALKERIADSDLIVLYKDYDQSQEAWNWPELAAEHAQFDNDHPIHDGKHFKVIARRTPLHLP